MRWEDINKVFEKIENDIKELDKYKNKDNFIEMNFQSFTIYGEYDDNSIDLATMYENMKMIKENNDLLPLFRYLMTKYI